jgi:hypothetical protein
MAVGLLNPTKKGLTKDLGVVDPIEVWGRWVAEE